MSTVRDQIFAKQIALIFSIIVSDTIKLLVTLFMIKLIAHVNVFKINITLTNLMKRYPKIQGMETLYHQTTLS